MIKDFTSYLGRESKIQVRLYYYFDTNVQLHAHLEVNDAKTEANLVCQALNQLVQKDKCFLLVFLQDKDIICYASLSFLDLIALLWCK